MRRNVHLTILLFFVFMTGTVLAQSAGNLFFVFLNPNPAKPLISKDQANGIRAAHLQNLDRLSEQGIIKASGSFEDGGDMLIMATDNIDHANQLLQADPTIKDNLFRAEVFPLSIANNWVCGAGKPYTLVTYQLVRFRFNDDYFGDLDKMAHDTRIFMANLNNTKDFVMMQGNFSIYNEGVLVLNVPTKEEAEKIIKKDPAVSHGQVLYEIRPLKIAKGTFCKHK